MKASNKSTGTKVLVIALVGSLILGTTGVALASTWGERSHGFGGHMRPLGGLLQAIAELDRLGSRLELGRAHYHRAEMLLEVGDFEKARAESELAINILDSCDAKRDTQRAQSLLA